MKRSIVRPPIAKESYSHLKRLEQEQAIGKYFRARIRQKDLRRFGRTTTKYTLVDLEELGKNNATQKSVVNKPEENLMVSKQDMISWVRSHFETAGASLYYDSSEGGFQYLPGQGPVDVRVALQHQFPQASEETIDSAARELEDEGPWVDFRGLDEQAE